VRAIVRSGYGSPDILRIEEVATPVPGDGEVLVRIRAASLNRADLDYLTGTPAITRAVMGLRRPRIERVGLDAAGEVEVVGPGVTRFKPGDRVYADLTPHGRGAFAELACAPEKAWHPIPAGVSFEGASTVPQSAILALEGLGGRDGVGSGDNVLINGASGCVGPFAVQMAKAAGAQVTGVCRTSKMDFVRSLGADHVIDYTRDDYTRNGQRYDRILDAAGNRSVFAVRRALAPNGVYQSFGGPSTARIVQTLILGPLTSLFGSRRMGLMTAWKPNDAREMAILGEMLEAGTLVPVIDRRYTLSQVPDAFRYLAAGNAQGKLVITM
jgi:NADPH:quinone reductase-like Zn-dependent oxidoreductase